jgi:hypothetical protein
MELYLDLEPPDWSLLGSLVLFGDEGDTVARTHERFGKALSSLANASLAKR